MPFCRKCGERVEEDDKICPYCHAPLPKKRGGGGIFDLNNGPLRRKPLF